MIDRNDHLLNTAVTFNIVVLEKGHALDINPQTQYHPAAAARRAGDRSHKPVTWLQRNSEAVSFPEEKGYEIQADKPSTAGGTLPSTSRSLVAYKLPRRRQPDVYAYVSGCIRQDQIQLVSV